MKHPIIITFQPPTVIQQMKTWCEKNIGPRDLDYGDWNVVWEGPRVAHGTQHRFEFTHSKHAMWFSLVWS